MVRRRSPYARTVGCWLAVTRSRSDAGGDDREFSAWGVHVLHAVTERGVNSVYPDAVPRRDRAVSHSVALLLARVERRIVGAKAALARAVSPWCGRKRSSRAPLPDTLRAPCPAELSAL